MSVLIKGMEMPESCWKCPLETDYGTCGYYSMFVEAGHDSDYEKRSDDCPLIELPTIEPFSTSGYVTTVTDLPPVEYVPVVRCKDCKHRPVDPEGKNYGQDLVFPDDYKCPCRCEDPWYSWIPDDEWFCASGERRTDEQT